nr:VCBS repeat-containing protein [Bacteroidota bacterium]
AKGDINGDGLEDFYICGAKDQAGVLYQQTREGRFIKTNKALLQKDSLSEDTDALFFDADGDGDQDLIVTSGSNEFSESSPQLRTRLYVNDGKGIFTSAADRIPSVHINAQCIEVLDIDKDNDLDIFIGGRLVGGQYPLPASSHLWINDGGKFTDKTKSIAPFLEKLGLVTDAIQQDMEGDGDIDLLIVGEWMKPTWLINGGSQGWSSSTIDVAGTGLWWTIERSDIDTDGDMDFLLGNLGWNNKFGGSQGTKLEVYANDFDHNGDYDVVLASTKEDKLLPVRGRECSSQEMPFILDKFPSYESYASAELNQILNADQLKSSQHGKLSTMNSVLLINEGSGTYKVKDLPAVCQNGPVKAFYADDFNGDGMQDFMYAGNHFPTEVETARYDALYPGICLGDGKGGFQCENIFVQHQLRIDDIRDIQKIKGADGKSYYMLSNNNGPLRIYSIDSITQPAQ